MRRPLSRRAMLRGAGACLALPLLDVMRPTSARAASDRVDRVVLVYRPHGARPAAWLPDQGVTDSFVLAPLQRHEGRVAVFTGVQALPPDLFTATEMPHDIAAMSVLTGEDHRLNRPHGANSGRSFDLLLAEQLAARGPQPPLDVIRLGAEARVPCPGPCNYNTTIFYDGQGAASLPTYDPLRAWRLALGTPAAVEDDATRSVRLTRRLTVLDRVLDDANALQARLGADDRLRFERYLDDVRALEQQAEALLNGDTCGEADQAQALLTGDFADIMHHTRFMMTLCVLALQCDRARVVGYMMGAEVSGRVFRGLGVTGTSHHISHHESRPDRINELDRTQAWEMEQVAWLIDQLADTPGDDGAPLLDSTLVMAIAGMGEPDIHDYHELPIVFAGMGDRIVTPGRVVATDGALVQHVLQEAAHALDAPVGALGFAGDGRVPGFKIA